MTIIKRKEIKSNEELYNIIPEVLGVGTVTFLADIPKNAIVTGVFVNGKSIEDYCFAEYRNNGYKEISLYPRNEMFEGHPIVAVYIDETCSGELYGLATSGSIESFVVEYIDVAIVEM